MSCDLRSPLSHGDRLRLEGCEARDKMPQSSCQVSSVMVLRRLGKERFNGEVDFVGSPVQ